MGTRVKWLGGLPGVALALLVASVTTALAAPRYEPVEGDILFQSLLHAPLIDAIEGATRSPWSHCGIVVQNRSGGWSVLEAAGPVRETPLSSWIAQGRDRRFVAYRFRERSPELMAKFVAGARAFLGRPYDIRYEMDDEKIYCSELVFKAYRHASGRALGTPRKLGDLNWQPFEALIREIEGGGLPLEREIISPRDLTEAPELTKVD